MSQTSTRPLPSPAIVAQDAVRRFPSWALLLLCAVYVATGFIGREPWRSADIAGFGVLFDIIGTSEMAWLIARIGAAGLMGLTLASTWYAAYYLARRDAAQPVPFAFGGEARPLAYARAIADGALLAFIACLGLAQLAHETTAALMQMSATALVFFGLAVYHYHPIKSLVAFLLGTIGLIFAMRGLKLDSSGWASLLSWRQSLHMLVWFTWPAWTLAGLALYKWRQHWLSLRPAVHIALPLLFVLIFLILLPCVDQKERWFLSALPSLAVLAAFALPTLRRGMKSLIDLFTLFFFSGCAFVIWVVWLAMQTGVPPQPAANVAKLVPGFVPSFSAPILFLALAATLAWGWLVHWRVGKHRPAIWMSIVLPAGGATLCWMLLMSLWLPLLDHARSYKPLMTLVQKNLTPNTSPAASCLQTHGLQPAQQAALRYYTDRAVVPAHRGTDCAWLIVDSEALSNLPEYVQMQDWQFKAQIKRPIHSSESWGLYRRKVDAQN